MRCEPTQVMEGGRIRSGELGSDRMFNCNGAFAVMGPIGRTLRVIVSDGVFAPAGCGGWEHASVSLYGRDSRTPTWIEMQWVKEQFWEDDEVVIQYHPRKSEYVNQHPGVLHMWRPLREEIPTPPVILV